MTPLAIILAIGAFFAALALVMTIINLCAYQPPQDPAKQSQFACDPTTDSASNPLVSVCIPARNEERNIEACLHAVLATQGANVEAVVYDDQSTDATTQIIARLAAADPRVRPTPTQPLPAGWNGKQHACWRMSQAARGRWMLFTDADVRLTPDCVRRALAAAQSKNLGLLSAFPHQIVISPGERLLVPMIFFILFSYLPFPRMRRSNDPSASAGCGQFLFISREAYDACGGHESCKDSMHDGVKLPRAVRRAGFRTDLVDGTPIASCRMYSGTAAAWRGFAKNAFEGLGSVTLLVVITVMHLLGHVLPWAVLLFLALNAALSSTDMPTAVYAFAAFAVAFNIVQRLLILSRTRAPFWLAFLHPLAVLAMTAVQWHSLVLFFTGQRHWRGRTMGRPDASRAAA
jgi:hypothetical protein